MFLFSNLATKKSQLHTGDFRADKGLQDNFKLLISNPQNLIDVGNLSGVVPSNVVPAAETVPFPLSAIYLDTTYASDNYSFPGQDRVIQQCCMQLTSIFKRDKSIVVPIRRLVLVGSYTIGKEKVGLAIARSLSTTIHCRDSKKRKIFRNCLMWPELEGLLCDDPLQAAVHIVPMGEICPKRISDYLNKLWPHYTHAVGVKPTGWTFETSKSTSIKTKSSRLNAASTFKSGETAMALPQKYSVHSHSRITELGETIRTKDAIIVLPVAYSEHSSFSELASFLDMAIPQASDDCKVIPTVSNSGSFFLRPSDYTKGSDLLRAWQNRYETPQVHGESPLNLTNE